MNKIIKLYKRSRKFYLKKILFLAVIIKKYIRFVYSCEIPFTADISDTVVFAHNGLGVVINSSTKIGDNTIIYQNVTLGNRNSSKGPIIGNNCLIGANALILGDIIIGDNVKIGAGAIVVKNVPSNSTIISDAAKIIKTNNIP